MNTKPILFNAEMVRAILDGRKTQTRREVKPAYDKGFDVDLAPCEIAGEVNQSGRALDLCPLGGVGALLWVRETFSGEYWLSDVKPSERLLVPHPGRLASLTPETWYWADGSPEHGDWEIPRPSIHMPRWASRLTLEITSVRVERLQDISESDAKAEGACSAPCTGYPFPCAQLPKSYRAGFKGLWDSLYKNWDANPWVWVIEFKVHHCNIDAFIAQREAA
ncbi:hypothetical protein [Gilvimarinus chinensis]|uniref:hypothetical protein n=1 Tax=Gilvimarinus chinensis TaxID=396005 RepID=UPI000372A0A4|nr:hypothetical protein [Gilvimarinus chinensis]